MTQTCWEKFSASEKMQGRNTFSKCYLKRLPFLNWTYNLRLLLLASSEIVYIFNGYFKNYAHRSQGTNFVDTAQLTHPHYLSVVLQSHSNQSSSWSRQNFGTAAVGNAKKRSRTMACCLPVQQNISSR